MELITIKSTIKEYNSKIEELSNVLDIDSLQKEMKIIDEKMAEPSFWDDQKAAQTVINELNGVKYKYSTYNELLELLDEVTANYSLIAEEYDKDLHNELIDNIKVLTDKVDKFSLELLLSDPYDSNNAILELHPGAGGTESQDWGEMLLRMYLRWFDKKGYKYEYLDYQPGDEAGIKSVTVLVKGNNAHGYLKSEKGVHRLVRISPFDSSGRRHTSFVSCEIMPEFNDDVEITINTEDIKVDTYRSSGAGGQSVNTTDSAVRITHKPTGVVVTCQNERSQIKNRDKAMKILKSKLYKLELDRQQEELNNLRGEQKDIGWGSQIRSYVFHPYSMVKDHRTGVETGNVQAVMDGNIDDFINGYLKYMFSK